MAPNPPPDRSAAAAALDDLRQRTALVIPVYLPPGVDQDLGARLLEDNLSTCLQQVGRASSICLSVDGQGRGWDEARDLEAAHGVQVCCVPQNKGKLQAVRLGAAQLLQDPGVEYLVVVDADGDHFANELLNLVRAARHARDQGRAGEVLVLGRRLSRHRPMGFLRGELEELADRVLLDALAYRAALSGRPLRLEYATTLEEYPDFHSGYKLFSRGAARAVFLSAPQMCGVAEVAYFRHAVEAVMSVEALLAGACLVLVNRSTLNQQPISTFGLLDRARLVADKIAWPCKRLEVPGVFVDQWLRNHLPRLLLSTLAPQGQEELGQIRRLVLQEFGIAVDAAEQIQGPLFV